MSDKFHTLMNAVDDDLLEEAMTPAKRKAPMPWIGAAVAACLVLVLGALMLPGRGMTMDQITAMGYDMKLPEQAEHIRYDMVSILEQEAAQASFVIRDTKYVYQAVKTDVQLQLSKGDEILVMDVMKMETPVTAPCDGTVTLSVAATDKVATGDVLAVIG